MKYCKKCNKYKELDEFYIQKKTKSDGTEYIYYRPDCIECTKKSSHQWRKDNPDRVKVYNDKGYKREENRESMRRNSRRRVREGKYKEYYENNKEKFEKYRINREMHKTHKISKEEWENCKNYFNYRCVYCGLPVEEHFRLHFGIFRQIDLHREHVDHEGANDLSNCVPSCQSCNSSKHTYALEQWYNEENGNFLQERLDKIHKWLDYDYKLYINE